MLIIVLEALSTKVRSKLPEELLCADDFALVSEKFEDLKGRLGAKKWAWELKGLRVNFKKIKMISSENAGKVIMEWKFPCVAFSRL